MEKTENICGQSAALDKAKESDQKMNENETALDKTTPETPEMTPKTPEMTPKLPLMQAEESMEIVFARNETVIGKVTPKTPEMTPQAPEMAPKSLEMSPQTPEMTPKNLEMTLKTPERTFKTPEMTPKVLPGTKNFHERNTENICGQSVATDKAQESDKKNNENETDLNKQHKKKFEVSQAKVIYLGALTTVLVRGTRDLESLGKQVLVSIFLYFNVKRKQIFSKKCQPFIFRKGFLGGGKYI